MALKLFDIDYDLKADSVTQDFKDIYNVDAINQSIDIFISTPYRIGLGYTNNLINTVFTDLKKKTNVDIIREIELAFERFYQVLIINNVEVESDPVGRRLYVSIDWSVKEFEISGNYIRYWSS